MKLKLKKLYPVLILLPALLLTACSASHESPSEFITWQPYSEGLQTAGTQGKKTFLYFRADW